MLNGHPHETMPALRVLGTKVLADILAYVQTLPAESMMASIVRGGRLYDNWFLVIKDRPPAKTRPDYPADRKHPAYPPRGKYAKDPRSNWRCKECHGWDYAGSAGAYSKGEHFTGIKGIGAMAGAEPAKIVALLRDETHRYAHVLDDRALRDLANFVGKGQVDMDEYIDRPTNKAKDLGTPYNAYFATICANCHGDDGTKITTMHPLGRVARSNPWEALHKILNGHPGEAMPALRVLDKQTLVGILAYIQTLPTER
jgi:mono/diheme cytochrome c family protein